MADDRRIAYFSMEVALAEGIPTYSGGLGILAGDTIRSAADLKVPMVGVTLLHRKGYFYQHLDASGWQTEEPVEWVVDDYLKAQDQRISVTLEGRDVQVRAWKFDVVSTDGFVIPVYLLDTDLPENSEWDRALTHFLYGGDSRYRLCQEVLLGMGGVRMLRALGHSELERYHMIEGVTGWAIGGDGRPQDEAAASQNDADCLYWKLEQAVMPAFYQAQHRFVEIMRHAIALNGSFFNTQRMIQQYVLKAYFS